MVRVGFTFEMTGAWLGGANYFRSLISALIEVPEHMVEPVIFAASQDVEALRTDFPDTKVSAAPMLTRGTLSWLLRKVFLKVTGFDWMLHRLLRRHNIDVLSHSGCLGPGASIPSIGWIADLQHRRLPDLCSTGERAARDATIERWHRNCSALLFSSQSARADFERFYGAPRLPVHVVPFVPLTRTVEAGAAAAIGPKYGLPEAYFYVPNQFWIHKNHRLVIDAALLLTAEGVDVELVFTGGSSDYRDDGHYDALVARAEPLGGRARFLGVVPYSDVLALMERATVIINPSMFEGWSTTVEEARNLGKAILLSDIDVHREQAPPRGSYFDPTDAQALATLMKDAWASRDRKGEEELRRQALPDVGGRRRAFGEAFQAVVLATREERGASRKSAA